MSLADVRALHVAAMPFPSPQGTQAAIGRMVGAIAQAGARPTLLTYDEGSGEAPPGVVHVRAEAATGRSMRSGPSLEKIVADAFLARAVAREARSADVIVAHHVEAALAALAAAARPLVFVAHTALGPELPTYFGPLGFGLGAAGEALDRTLASRADVVAAVSPLLASMLARRSGRVVHALPIPWSVPAEPTRAEREDARARLGIQGDAAVVLYAGNLDAYQGLDVLGRALERLFATRDDVLFLLATESSPIEIVPRLGPSARARTRRARLRSELDRRLAHAAATVAVVPRRSPGGVPVKLLDAMARGVPVVAGERALAGHPLEAHVWLAEDDDDASLALALEAALDEAPSERARRVRGAREHVRREHSDGAFLRAYDRAVAAALSL